MGSHKKMEEQAGRGYSEQKGKEDFRKIRSIEEMLLQIVRNGDLAGEEEFSKELSRWMKSGEQSEEYFAKARRSAIIFCSLVSRAAMESGVIEDEAYELENRYIYKLETEKEPETLSALMQMMYADFVLRVYKLKDRPSCSRNVARCLRYIDMNPDKKITAALLADLVGCSEYYLTGKFREEMGESVSDYVNRTRIEKSKTLLTDTDISVKEIANRLGFASRNYFTRVFRESTGMTPSEYRSSMAKASFAV